MCTGETQLAWNMLPLTAVVTATSRRSCGEWCCEQTCNDYMVICVLSKLLALWCLCVKGPPSKPSLYELLLCADISGVISCQESHISLHARCRTLGGESCVLVLKALLQHLKLSMVVLVSPKPRFREYIFAWLAMLLYDACFSCNNVQVRKRQIPSDRKLLHCITLFFERNSVWWNVSFTSTMVYEWSSRQCNSVWCMPGCLPSTWNASKLSDIT